MRCRKAQTLFSAHFDGELDESRARRASAHLAECRACRRFVGNLPGFNQALDSLTVPEPRPGFTGRLMARLPEARPGRFRLREWLDALRPAPVAAAVLAAVCGAAMALSMTGEQAVQVAPRHDRVETLYVESFDALPGQSASANYLALLQEGGR